MTKAITAGRLSIRRGLGLEEAALYVGIGATLFLRLVEARTMPKPRLVPGSARKVWDVMELDAAFDDLPTEGDNRPNSWADVGTDTATAR